VAEIERESRMRRRASRARLLLSAATVVALVFLFLFGLAVAYTLGFGYDSHAYWVAAHDPNHLYERAPLEKDAYLYSPAFVQVVWPLTQLPWPVFAVVWGALLASIFFWLLKELPPRWFIPAMLACVPEILTGNVYAFMAAAMVLGVSQGWPWALPLLTKVAPGVVGFAFLALRGDVKRLNQAVLATLATVGVSLSLGVGPWVDWGRFLVDNRSSGAVGAIVPVPVRVAGAVVAAGLVVVAARRRALWALPLAAILLSPTLGPNTLTLLAAAPRLVSAQSKSAGGRVV
jgi:hypothetical protein